MAAPVVAARARVAFVGAQRASAALARGARVPAVARAATAAAGVRTAPSVASAGSVLQLRAAMSSSAPPEKREGVMRVLGLQSGNACDGIDAGIFEFEEPERNGKHITAPVKYKCLANKTYPFDKTRRNRVLGFRAMRHEDGNEYAKGNYEMGEWCAEAGLALCHEAGIDIESIDLIGSHGQSISGHPHWEFGDLSVIAQRTGRTVAGDFRPADVAAGGEGTPVTCTYDSIMLRPEPSPENKWRIAINIGGTSSVSFLPPRGSSSVPVGLDPGLGVFFMDLATEAHNGHAYDDDGKLGRSGTVNEQLLALMFTHKYYQQKELPIGVGTDDFPETLFHHWKAHADDMGVTGPDLVATLTELTAKQIALACKNFCPKEGVTNDVVLRGGIRANSYFKERLAAQMSEQLGLENFGASNLKQLEELTDTPWLEEDSWENCMYALMGYTCFRGFYNNVPSCTGASRHVVGGRIAPGDNYAELYQKFEVY
jgi:anhydro-N-acetylmuramic acid kinase